MKILACLILSLSMLLKTDIRAQNKDSILNAYMNVKNELIKGDSKKAKKNLVQLRQTIEESADFNEKDVLLKSVIKMGGKSELEQQRSALATVSVVLWKVVRNLESFPQKVYYQYCSMKKAYWLSYETEIRNPYYGNKMLNCGSTVKSTP